jgi:GT2 family glycosyltransferase
MVESVYSDVRVIRNERNLGFAAANNIGIRNAKGNYVALINSDVVVLPGCFDRLLEHMELQPDVGIIGPRILWPDQTLQDSCRKFPSLWNNFCTVSYLRLLFPKSGFFSGEHMMYFEHNCQCFVDSLVGCFLVVRRSAIAQVGLLDERFFFYAEEVDWCKRFWNAKWRVLFFPEAQAIHVGAGSSSNEPLRFATAQQRAVLQYWAKHHSYLVVACCYLLRLVHQFVELGGQLIKALVEPKKRDRWSRVLIRASCLREVFWLGFEVGRGRLHRRMRASENS